MVITPPASSDLVVGQTIILLSAVKSSTGQDMSNQVVTWSSSDPSVASISPTGALTGLKVGTAVITGSSSGQSASLTINVKPAPVGNVVVIVQNALVVAQSASATAVATDPTGSLLTGRTVAWSSSNPSVAIVSSSGVVTGISAGTATIQATVDGIAGSAPVQVTPAAVANISVSLTQSTAGPGQAATATAVATDAVGSTLTGKVFTWSSSNTGVATISQLGVVMAVGAGTTTITAASENRTGTASFTVIVAAPGAVATVNLSVLNPRPLLGLTTQINATTHDIGGAILTNRLITWSSSNSAVASVSQSGLVTATGFGSAIITATSETAVSTLTIQVIPPAVSTVTVQAPAATLQPTQTTQLAVTLKDATGALLSGRIITYSSATTSVATVSSTGLVSALAKGSSVITVTSEGVVSTVTVTVPPVALINVSAGNAVLQPAATTQVSAALLDGSGTAAVNRVLSWSSSAPLVATVSATGMVTALGKGTANITATSEGVTGILTITVPTVTTITITAPNSNALQPAQVTQATAVLLDLGGGTATNRIITWSSGTPAVATVSGTGVVTGVAAGTSVLSVTSEGVTGTLTVVVPAVNTVTVVSAANSLPAGAATQATATLRDANNALATNRPITWSSATPSVATVSATGLVTAVSVGTSVISALSEGKTGVFTFTVIPPGGTITLTTPQNSLMLNEQTQLTALVTNSSGAVIPNATLTWTSSDATRATVSATGLVRQVSGGSRKNVTVTAQSGTVTQTSVIQLVGHPVETIAALPQQFINTTVPAAPDVGGVVIPVPVNGNLQAALNSARLGDVIELANGAVFTGNFSLPNKGAGTKWITIRPANMSGMPAPGSRMTPTIAAAVRLPIIQSPNSNNAIGTNAGAHHYRFIGIEMTVRAGVVQNYAPIALENNQTSQTQLSQVPHNFVLDRVYIHGNATVILRRCLLLNSAFTAVIDSDLRECHDDGSDSQAIAGYNGPGPFKIVNNYLEGAGENVIFGGSDPGISGLVPSDIEIRRNHIFKPASWKGSQWLIKNHLELKNSQRVLIEGNIFENNWAHGQDGTSIVLKTVNQGGTCSWCVTQDVTIRYNVVRNVGSAFNIGGAPDGFNQSIHARRMTIHDNLVTAVNTGVFTGVARAFYMSGDPADVTIAHNTVMSAGTMNGAFVFGPFTGDPTTGARTIRFNARDNMMDGGATGISGDRLGGGAAFTYYAASGSFVGNVLVYTFTTAGYPLGNFITASYTPVGFISAPTNFSLASTSTYKSAGSDGRDPGADLSAVASATANVIVP